MARLLNFPRELGILNMRPLNGPRTAGSASTTGLTGWVQTVSSPFGLHVWRFEYVVPTGKESRLFRGLVSGLHGGANALRVTFKDHDRHWSESGLGSGQANITWSNGQPWSGGGLWATSPPVVPLADLAARGSSVVRLADQHWAGELDVGDWIGFMPFHFGLYFVTQVIDHRLFRIWPPLRKALTTDDYASLEPVMAMRPLGEDSAGWAREPAATSDAVLTLVEVGDQDVRDYFAD